VRAALACLLLRCLRADAPPRCARDGTAGYPMTPPDARDPRAPATDRVSRRGPSFSLAWRV